ncbi:MAG: hypothetical protein GY715_14850 [Planctomycetes bacterium]|nr:hypothetical protein [Planctomycetota bacterium]
MTGPRWCVLFAFGLVALGGPAVAADPDADPFADNACVQCHRDLPGRSSAIVELEWARSSHHAAGVGCDACHGGNAAVRRDRFDSDEAWKDAAHQRRDPEFMFMQRSADAFASSARGRNVSYFCGKCHANIKEKHLGSPHGEFGDPTCLYCHGQGSHAITEPTLDIIDGRSRAEGGRCSVCHLASTMNTLSRIKKTLTETEERIEDTTILYDELGQWGYHSLELERLYHDARQVRSRLRQVFHSFDMREINNFVAEIEMTVDRTVATHEIIGRLRAAQRRQAVIGGLVAVMLLAFALLLVYYRLAFCSGHGGDQAAAPVAEG